MFSKFALGQSLQSGDFDLYTTGDSIYSGQVHRDGRSWLKLRKSYDVDLNQGLSVFHTPGDLTSSQSSTLQNSSQCELSSGVKPSGQLIAVYGDMSVVRLHGQSNLFGCDPAFNSGDKDPNLVFVKTSDLKDIYKTPPTLKDGAKKVICSLANVPVQMAKKVALFVHPDGSVKEKTLDDLEKYLACYPTAHQADYDKYYKKLFDIAGTTFNLAYNPNRKSEPLTAILDPADYQKFDSAADRPFIITPKTKVMKCIALRESGWDSSAVHKDVVTSEKGKKTLVNGATGLGQQTSVNVKDIDCLLNGCEGHTPQKWAQAMWKAYFERVKKQFSTEDWRHLTTYTKIDPKTGAKTQATCTETMKIKDRDALCPVNSLAAMALSQVAIELKMRMDSPLHKDSSNTDYSPDETFYMNLVRGTSHDAGIGRASESVRSSDNPVQWALGLFDHQSNDRTKELVGYYQSLKHCLTDGDSTAMDGKTKKDCHFTPDEMPEALNEE